MAEPTALTTAARRWPATLARVVALLAAIVVWAFVDRVAEPWSQVAMFAAALGLLFAALHRYPGWALLVAAVMALPLDASRLTALNGWNLGFMLMGAAGLWHLSRRFPALACVAASLPFWAMAQAFAPAQAVALGLSITALAMAMVRPLISRRRHSNVSVCEHLAAGPLVPVPERVFGFTRGRSLLTALTGSSLLLTVAGIATALVGWADGLAVAGIGAALASGFGFSMLLNGRMRFRIDQHGVHSRLLWRELSIPWSEVAEIEARDVVMSGLPVRWHYRIVRSPRAEILFADDMPGAAALRSAIESATGLHWS